MKQINSTKVEEKVSFKLIKTKPQEVQVISERKSLLLLKVRRMFFEISFHL